jgi:hypothetical protein
MLRAWQLAILRFAVTRDDADRLGVLEIARDLDSLCCRNEQERHFRFFRRTSIDVCAAILQPSGTSPQTLREYLARIDDMRIRRAFAAALRSVREAASVKKRFTPDGDLWKGLSSRSHVWD